MKFWILLFTLSVGMAAEAASFPTLSDYAFPAGHGGAAPMAKGSRAGPRTDALLIYQNGRILLEKYDRGYTAETKHILWSTSKSVTSLVFAAAEYQNKVKREDSICIHDSTIPKDHCKIRFQDLLQWSSGLRWVEEYEKSAGLRKASVLAMFYGEGLPDMQAFVLRHPFVAEPGTLWRYSSGDTQLLASLLPSLFGAGRGSSGGATYNEQLFKPLGISRWTVEEDGRGHALGASNIYLTARGLLKIGRLILQNGEWEGHRLFSPQWLDFVRQVPASFANRPDSKNLKHVGGASFWINRPAAPSEPPPWPAAPADTLVTMGHWGQFMIVIPSKQVVAIRFGDTRDDSFSVDKMLELLLKDLP